jgi:hypothetical protein
MGKLLWIGLLAAVASIVALPAAAQSRLFSDQAPLHFVITGPFSKIAQGKYTGKTPYPATLTLTDTASPQTFPIELRARGNTRRTAGYCSFPPLSLKFEKKSVHGSVFQGQKRIKLVTYCRPQSDYEQRVILEYITYRLYNLITPISFQVRSAEVTYRSGEGDVGVTRFGYLIEDAGDVADRNQREVLTAASRQLTPAQLDPHAAARAAVFEFMIGNLDWDFLAAPAGTDCCHNSRLIGEPGATPATAKGVAPLPYDFDYSGFVDSPYAGPPEGIPVDRVTDRYYRGYCASAGGIASVVDEYRAHRADMLAIINNEARLTSEFRAKTARFMDAFFALLDNPGQVQRELVKHCR